jgi:hypothetical protein
MVESTIGYSKSGSPDIASKIGDQMPLMLNRSAGTHSSDRQTPLEDRSDRGRPTVTLLEVDQVLRDADAQSYLVATTERFEIVFGMAAIAAACPA